MFPTSNKSQTANNRCYLLVTQKYINVKYDSERLCIIWKKNQTLFYNDSNFVELGDITSEARSRNIYVLIPRFVRLQYEHN